MVWFGHGLWFCLLVLSLVGLFDVFHCCFWCLLLVLVVFVLLVVIVCLGFCAFMYACWYVACCYC